MRRKKQPYDISRRTFLSRSSLLLTGLGVGATVQTGLLDAIARKANRTFGTAMAAPNPGVIDFHIEISFRLGLQSNALFPSPGHRLPIGIGQGERFGPEALNFYWSPQSVQEVVTTSGRKLYLAGVDGQGGLGANPLAAFADRIAVSESISDAEGTFPHTAQWRTRFPNAMAPPPSAMHAHFAPADVPIKGIRLGIPSSPFTGVSHDSRNLAGLEADVTDAAGMVQLYKPLPLAFSLDELKVLVGTFDQQNGSLMSSGLQQRLDEIWRGTVNLQGSAPDGSAAKKIDGGRALSTLEVDLSTDAVSPMIPSNPLAADMTTLRQLFGYDDPNLDLGQVHLGKTFLHAYQAFGFGLLRTLAIDIDSQDWHTDRPVSDLDNLNFKQGRWATILTRTLSNLLTFASNTPNPIPGRVGTIADAMHISITSEFSRSPFNNNGIDNGDGYAQSFIHIGPNVEGGTYGDVDTFTRPLPMDPNGFTQYGASRLVSFDPDTGATAPGAGRHLPGSAWKTHMTMLGLTESDYSMYGVDGNVIPCVIKST